VLIYESGTVANQPLVANAGPDKNFSLPTNTTTLTGSGTDPDGTITAYQWTKIAGPSQYTLASPTLAKTGLSDLAEGVYQFELKVTDNSGATAKDTISVTVNAVSNQSPVADAGKKQTISLPVNSATLNGNASSDKDGTIAAYKWSEISGPTSASIETAGLVSTNVTMLTKGVYTFELKVTDNKGAVGRDTVTITVNNKAKSNSSNQPPLADAGKKQTISLPQNSATLNGSASNDQDGTIAAYKWSEISGPTSASIETAGLVSTKVKTLAKGVYTFELKVTDNKGAIGRDTVTITVNEKATSNSSNQPPVADAGNKQTILLPLNSAILNGSSSSDKDGTIAAYSWSEISGPSSADIETPKLISTNVTTLVKGTYKFELKVTDNQDAIGRDTVTITVNSEASNNSPNQLPVANAGIDINMTLPTNSVTIAGKGSDADGSVISYKWSKISGHNCIIQNPEQAKTVVNNLTQGLYVFELEVTDNKNAIGRDTLRITVNASNPDPAPSVPDRADSNDITTGKNSFTIYPNPVTDNFNVEINSNRHRENVYTDS
jgi:6-phosphogluconolactonase (cycloisomerase 2 family)